LPPPNHNRRREDTMKLTMTRITIFTPNMERMTAFYRDVLGLTLRIDIKGYKEFDAGGCSIALHNGASVPGRRAPKLVFPAKDVPKLRAELVARGAKLGKVMSGRGLTRCEGKDPDGNPFQLSSHF
jgi:predicted enzyme related to lactoylglutathione lyase